MNFFNQLVSLVRTKNAMLFMLITFLILCIASYEGINHDVGFDIVGWSGIVLLVMLFLQTMCIAFNKTWGHLFAAMIICFVIAVFAGIWAIGNSANANILAQRVGPIIGLSLFTISFGTFSILILKILKIFWIKATTR